MFTVNVGTLINRARVNYDHETAAEATSFFTNAQLFAWLFEGYSKLYRLVCSTDGGIERFATSTSLASPYTLPAATMRIIGVDATIGGETVRLNRFNFAERHLHQDTTQPAWRVSGGALTWSPSTATPGTVTLWYIPIPDSTNFDNVADNFDSMEGFDDYLIFYINVMMALKEEKDISEYAALMNTALTDVMMHAREYTSTEPVTVQEVNALADEYFYNA